MSDIVCAINDGAEKIYNDLIGDPPKKYYLVSEEDLIEYLVCAMGMWMNEQDGVDCWEWYGESYQDTKRAFLPDAFDADYDESALRDMDFTDIAKLMLKSGVHKSVSPIYQVKDLS